MRRLQLIVVLQASKLSEPQATKQARTCHVVSDWDQAASRYSHDLNSAKLHSLEPHVRSLSDVEGNLQTIILTFDLKTTIPPQHVSNI
ncbi:hypothetical protein J6590_082229 [Homalodisca vitripennis]|nr:hypothetical protein J6590_082229 [Homalodisca vitripennis]